MVLTDGTEMLSKEELRFIYRHAYLPEHLPDYVEAVSGAKPHLAENYLCFLRRKHLIFIGFPLGKTDTDIAQAYLSACERSNPSTVAIVAPAIWLPEESCEKQAPDQYYRLDLPLNPVDSSVAYMLRRAQRELNVTTGGFGREHRKIVKAFLRTQALTTEQRRLFEQIPKYLKQTRSARILEARRKNMLVAFTIVDLGSADFAFYLFNFRALKTNVPGASDLLLQAMVDLAQSEGKKALNLGLGIHPGIQHFKEKWGGVPFLPYASALVQRAPMDIGRLADKL